MDAAESIRNAVLCVSELQARSRATPQILQATKEVKAFQALRFEKTYADFLDSTEYSAAAQFFLNELYSDKDYSLRDEQFARIAGALQTLFPAQVISTAVAMANLHRLTEELDHQMALVWLETLHDPSIDNIGRYVICWQRVGRRIDRLSQLRVVIEVGNELDRLTRLPGLRFMLKLMRRPAGAAGLDSLQKFLEAGFDTFAGLAGKGTHARLFLDTIHARELQWIEQLSNTESSAGEQHLRTCMPK